ncbi:unnamed protein product [Rotaria sordida]|nr:unnamed protein product [Rotaria sordida]
MGSAATQTTLNAAIAMESTVINTGPTNTGTLITAPTTAISGGIITTPTRPTIVVSSGTATMGATATQITLNAAMATVTTISTIIASNSVTMTASTITTTTPSTNTNSATAVYATTITGTVSMPSTTIPSSWTNRAILNMDYSSSVNMVMHTDEIPSSTSFISSRSVFTTSASIISSMSMQSATMPTTVMTTSDPCLSTMMHSADTSSFSFDPNTANAMSTSTMNNNLFMDSTGSTSMHSHVTDSSDPCAKYWTGSTINTITDTTTVQT